MSWKLRRAAYYQSKRGEGGANPQFSKWINFFLLICIALTFIFLIIAANTKDIEAYPTLDFLRYLGGFSLLVTPFLFILACLGNTFAHGLPNIAAGKTRAIRKTSNTNDQGESTWNKWIEDDGKKRTFKADDSYVYDAPSKIPPQKPQYTNEQKNRLEEIQKEIKKSQEKIEKDELKIKEYKEQYEKLVAQEKLEKRKEKLKKSRKKNKK